MGINNITEAQGFPIAITGLTIVFVALTLISVFIALLPRVMEALSAILPEESHADPAKASRAAMDEQLVAAIGFALHQRKRNTPPK